MSTAATSCKCRVSECLHAWVHFYYRFKYLGAEAAQLDDTVTVCQTLSFDSQCSMQPVTRMALSVNHRPKAAF